MKVLLTGAFGNVGLSTLKELLVHNHDVTILEKKTARNRRYQKKYANWAKVIWGDVRSEEDVRIAIAGQDAVIHLAAIIPPLADIQPELARSVNVGGTANIVQVIESLERKPKLLFSSSVAVYGDRLKNPMIELDDEVSPNSFDGYAKHKVEAETIIRNSSLDWTVLRLTFIVPPASFKIDRMMFEMPLATSIEVCDTRDVGVAFANAVERDDLSGQTLHIAGGEKCRTTYGEYINRLMTLFGVGRDQLPVEAFAKRGYHCGFMNTDASRDKLSFQIHSLEDHYREVQFRMRLFRFLARLVRPFRPLLIGWIANRSPYYREWKKNHTRLSVSMNGANLI